MKMEPPRFALVRWPDAYDQTVPSCIPLDGVPVARSRGAVIVAEEDDELCQPSVFNPPRITAGEDPA